MTVPAGVALPPRAARLAAQLEGWERRTIALLELWALFASADPAASNRPSRRADLAATLDVLTATGMLTPSKAQDHTAMPPLPVRLTLTATAATPSAAALAQAVPWRPELAWASSARLTVGQVGVLQTINSWLRDRGRDDDVAPSRERSLELFGHEKRLDKLLGTSLFAPGRLSLSLLRTFRAHPPLPTRRIGTGPALLVIENADTFSTMTEVLGVVPSNVGLVGWGAGAGFEASVRSIAELPDVEDIVYFGDLDADGLRIPAAAAAAASEEGLPVVRPARGLYRLLLDVGVGQPGQPVLEPGPAAERSGWLEGFEAERAAGLLCIGERIPQETLTARVLAAHPDVWMHDIR